MLICSLVPTSCCPNWRASSQATRAVGSRPTTGGERMTNDNRMSCYWCRECLEWYSSVHRWSPCLACGAPARMATSLRASEQAPDLAPDVAVGDSVSWFSCWPASCPSSDPDSMECERHKRYGLVVAIYPHWGAWEYVIRDIVTTVDRHMRDRGFRPEPLPPPVTLADFPCCEMCPK